FFFQAEDGIRDYKVTGVQTCALPILRAQYLGYTSEEGVAPDSQVETFMAMRVWIDNWRWAGVPFYIRTGKKLAARATEVVLQFQDRKSTRLNSSHLVISYAVFCLKKK